MNYFAVKLMKLARRIFGVKAAVFWQFFATGFAVSGVLLNNYQNKLCFPVWIVSNLVCLAIHLKAGMSGLAMRDAIFTILAVMGWRQWSGL